LTSLEAQLHASRVARLRASTEEAHAQGQYGVEAASLEALLALGSQDPAIYAWAVEYLPIAQQNRAMLGPYSVIQDRMADDPDKARELLQKLWTQAPYFGDPANLAPALGLRLPPTYAHDKAAAAERKRRDEATAAEHARLELASGLLQTDLAGKNLHDVRTEVRRLNYDLDSPAMVAAIEQNIRSWDESKRIQPLSPSQIRQPLN
jgi:hypothetical protein